MLMTVAWLSRLWQALKNTYAFSWAAVKYEIILKSFPNNRAGWVLTHLSGCPGRGRRSCNILWADVCRSQCRISLQSAKGKNDIH